jgi:hypothetical protein
MTKNDFIPITNGRLTEEEIVEKGTIPISTYNTYIKLAGGYMFSSFVLLLFAVNGIASGNQNLKFTLPVKGLTIYSFDSFFVLKLFFL